jgi:hypothetical protein
MLIPRSRQKAADPLGSSAYVMPCLVSLPVFLGARRTEDGPSRSHCQSRSDLSISSEQVNIRRRESALPSAYRLRESGPYGQQGRWGHGAYPINKCWADQAIGGECEQVDCRTDKWTGCLVCLLIRRNTCLVYSDWSYTRCEKRLTVPSSSGIQLQQNPPLEDCSRRVLHALNPVVGRSQEQ